MANHKTAETVKTVELTQEDINLLGFIKSSLEATRGSAWTMGGMYSDAYFLGCELSESDDHRTTTEAAVEKLDESMSFIERLLQNPEDPAV